MTESIYMKKKFIPVLTAAILTAAAAAARRTAMKAIINIGQHKVGDELKSGQTRIIIKYPSLIPTSFGFAYQRDPALVFVSGCGWATEAPPWMTEEFIPEYFEVTLEKLEDAFEVYRERELLGQIKSDRKGTSYDNFDFKVENQELMTVNGFTVCKYSGTDR